MKLPLPVDCRPLTDEEIQKGEKQDSIAEYYGVPFGIFDANKIENQKQRDQNKACLLILQDKEIPKDLGERLLRYKEEDKRSSEG